MLGFLKSFQWKWARVPQRESWAMDRNWHQFEAERNLKAGNLVEAERNLAAALEDADQRTLAPAIRIGLRVSLAEVQRRLNRLHDAENVLRQAALISVQNSDSEQYLECLDALAEIFVTTENFAALEEVSLDAVRLNVSEARVLRLALAQEKNGRPGEAVESFGKAIALREQSRGARHHETGDLLREAGQLCRRHGEHAKAQEYLRRAQRIHEAACGEDSKQALADAQELAASLEESGDVAGSAAQYERALMLKQRNLGTGNIDALAEMQYMVAARHAEWGNLERARELLESCIGQFQRTGGARLAVAYETLAQVEERSGRVSFATVELAKAAQIWEKCGAPRRREFARNMDYQADLLDQLRQRREANWLRKKAADLLATLDGEPAESRV